MANETPGVDVSWSTPVDCTAACGPGPFSVVMERLGHGDVTTKRLEPIRGKARERNRRLLLEATAHVAARHGYAGTSLIAVASRAGLTTGAVYSIFGSKAEMFLELLREQWQVPTPPEVLPHNADIASYLYEYGRTWGALLHQPGARQALELGLEFHVALMRDPALLEQARGLLDGPQAVLSARLQELADQRALPPGLSAAELARCVIATLQGLSTDVIFLGEEPDADFFGRVARRLAGTD